jgi:dUTP pyrophosphatase
MEKPVVLCKKLSEHAVYPLIAHPNDAGWDLFSAYEYVIDSKQIVKVETDIALVFPPGFYGQVCGKSGLAFHYGIGVLAGVIDAEYTGGIGCILINHGPEVVHIKRGAAVAQIIPKELVSIPLRILTEEEALPITDRGAFGFGEWLWW